MLLSPSIFRSALMLLTAVGFVVPAGMVSPCRCAEPEGCCAHRAASARKCCVKQDSNLCCSKKRVLEIDVACADEGFCAWCPCCSEPASPAVPASDAIGILPDFSHAPAIASGLVGIPAPADISLNYLAIERGSPPGHPALRLHELKCVWLN